MLAAGANFNKKKNEESIRLFMQTPSSSWVTDSNHSSQKISKIEIGEAESFRKQLKIKVKGDNVPDPTASFEDMNIKNTLKNRLLQNIELSAWKEPTAIQMQAIPSMLEVKIKNAPL